MPEVRVRFPAVPAIFAEKRPVEPTAPAVAARPAKQKKLDAGGGRHNARDKKFGGGRDANRPFLASLFSHNPTVPELSLPETTPAESDVFSGRQFSDLDLHPHLVANVTKALGGGEMTRVQKEALPAVLAGGDCLVRAQTGSGKTLSYLLPIVQGLQAMEPLVTRESGLFALVIVPTRELALQTHTCAVSLMKAFVRLVPGYLTGGERTLAEKRRLRRGLNLLVATPGRLLAHLASTRNLRLCALRWLVLDEADLLLDMGYERDVSSVVEAIREQRTERTAGPLQTIMLSATLDDRVKHLAGLSLSEPTFIDVASAGGATSGAEGELVTPGQLRQFVAVVPAKLRMVVLAAFLLWKCASRDEGKLVVFMNTQDMVDYHAALLESCLPGRGVRDLRLFRLHGSMSQQDRTGVFNDFRNARTGVLICTVRGGAGRVLVADVAARGVDLPRVHWIVQHTPPCRPADYVHRVGRTARAGGGGAALVLLTPAETGLVDLLRKGGLSVCDLSVETILASLVAPSGRRGGAVEAAATQLQLVMEETVAQDRHLLDMARKAFTSLTRAYATYPAEMKSMLSVRTLHLGHYAKSLCLRETPTALGRWRAADPGGQARRKRFERPPGATSRVRIPQASDLSEFQSGLDAGQSRKHKKKKGKRA